MSFSALFFMFTQTWITEKDLERVIENKRDEFRRKKNMEIQSGGEKMKNARGQPGENERQWKIWKNRSTLKGTLGSTQYRNKNGKYRNTASKIVLIPIPHILITFIIGSAYLWVLPSSAFNYLRHLCTRCPCFFNILVVGKFLANFHWKEPFGRSTQQLTNSNKNNSWKRENKQTNQPKPFPRTSSASLDESIV